MSAALGTAPMDRSAAIERSGWSSEVRLFQPHNPAWYLYCGLVLLGTYRYLSLLSTFTHFSTAIVIALVSQILYCLPWVWFLTHRDRYDRQSGKLAWMAFLWGGLVATYVLSLPGNNANLSLMVKLFGLDFHNRWGPALSAPIVEESTKYIGLVVLVLLARNHIRSAYDGFLLGAFVGLGFQVFENILYILNGAASSFGSREVAGALQVMWTRTAVGFWSHALFSAIAGSGLGYFLGATDRSFGHRLAVAIGVFLIACVAHGCWDAVLGFVGFAPIGVVIGTIAVILAWRFAERRQREFVKVLLAEDAANGTVTQAEMAAIAGRSKDRRAYLSQIKASSGVADAKRAGYVLDAAIDLAKAIAATDALHSPEAERARAEIARARLLSVG